jgi:glycosyltransferase involved in cell wall biosynthesis
MRLLFVPPRFGEETVGGAERLVHALAANAVPDGWNAEVATTCATNHFTWENALPAGESVEDDVLVRRFEVGLRQDRRYHELHPRVLNGTATYADELEWLGHSVWSPDLQRFLEESAADYDLAIFSPYLFGTTLWGAQVDPGRSALIPCLHDEPYARLTTVRTVVEATRGCLFNAPAEERLARRLYSVRAGGVVGMGFEAPENPPAAGFADRRGLGPYLLCAGRIEEGKRVDVAVEYAVQYAAERSNAPKLVLIGSGTYQPPKGARDIVVHAGLLDPTERRAAYAEALAIVNASHMESLSIVLMEAWLEGTPALVAVGSEVLREHAERSGGGLVFGSYEEFRDAVDELLEDESRRLALGEAGRAYVLDEYGWPSVRRRFRATVEQLAA